MVFILQFRMWDSHRLGSGFERRLASWNSRALSIAQTSASLKSKTCAVKKALGRALCRGAAPPRPPLHSGLLRLLMLVQLHFHSVWLS